MRPNLPGTFATSSKSWEPDQSERAGTSRSSRPPTP